MKELSTISVVVTKGNSVVGIYGYTPDEQGIKEANAHYVKLSTQYLTKFEYNVSLVKAMYKGDTNVRYVKSVRTKNRFAKIVDGKFDTIKHDGKILGAVVHGCVLKDTPYEDNMGWSDCTEAEYQGVTFIGFEQMAKPVARTIHEYVKDVDGNRVGVFVGAGVCGKGFDIGWSKVNVKGGDVFDKHQGFDIALNRAKEAKAHEQKLSEVPESLMEYYKYFQGRCQRYFKCEQLLK